jgi:phenylalanine-4-hydroxylase
VKDCEGQTLFQPEWGTFDMAVGEKITSVFCGAADKDAFEEVVYKSSQQTYHREYDDRTRALHSLYSQVREIRDTNLSLKLLPEVFKAIQQQYPEDWLCALEILELLKARDEYQETTESIERFLNQKAVIQPELKKLIEDGLYLINHPINEGFWSIRNRYQ